MPRNPRLAQVHIARKDLALTEDSYRAILSRITGQESSKGLTDAQLDKVLAEFKRLGWKVKSRKPSSKPYVRMIFGLWAEMCREGIPADPGRDSLISFVRRMTITDQRPAGLSDPNWLSVEEAGKVIEALKAWRVRELAKRGQG